MRKGASALTSRESLPPVAGEEHPSVLVQLPIYNESSVVERLIDSAAQLDWPGEKLWIQVLDDSDDGSSEAVAAAVEVWRQRDVQIEHIRRGSREGYKAGALAHGLELCETDLVAIFDADFVIPSDYLQLTAGAFVEDVKLALVQARWGFTNSDHSLLTRVQTLLLDGHFHVEHRARAQGERFFNFNGTAGVWRRSAIDDAGGWRADTVTEDLDLSLRAWLRGWRFRYVDGLEVPSALPEAMPAFKIQQNRWVSGSVQTALQHLTSVWKSSLRVLEKVDLSFYLLGNLIYFWLLLLALAIPPAVMMRFDRSSSLILWGDVPFFVFATGSVYLFYVRARRPEFPLWRTLFLWIPAVMAVGLGMTVHNARAIARGLFGRSRVFERTPKGGLQSEVVGAKVRRRRFDGVRWTEPLMAIYVGGCWGLSVLTGSWISAAVLGAVRLGLFLCLPQDSGATPPLICPRESIRVLDLLAAARIILSCRFCVHPVHDPRRFFCNA